MIANRYTKTLKPLIAEYCKCLCVTEVSARKRLIALLGPSYAHDNIDNTIAYIKKTLVSN